MAGGTPTQTAAARPAAAAATVRRKRVRPAAGLRPLAIALAAVLALLVIPPILSLIAMSFSDTGSDGAASGLTLAHYAELIQDRSFIAVVFNTVVFAGSATLISLLVGGTLAWLVERTNTPFKRLATLTAIVSLGTPYVLYVMAWLYLLGHSGPVNQLYRALTGSSGVLFDPYTLPGMIIVEGFLWSPLVYLLMAATFRMANAEMEEAARVNGATVLDTIWLVSLRLAWPAILALAIFVFIRNVESFEVPALVGIPGNVRVLTTDIYLAVKEFPPQLGHAASFSVVMLVLITGLIALYGRIARRADRYASVTGKGYRPRPFDLGAGRAVAGAVILVIFLLVLALPLMALIWMAATPFVGPVSVAALKNMTLANFRAVLTAPTYLTLVTNTLTVSIFAATAAMLITGVAGWLAARRQFGGRLIDQLATAPLIFPGIVLGVAAIDLSLRLPFALYGTIWLIGIAYLIRYMPYGMRYAYSGVLQLHKELEEASAVSGAGLIGTFLRIVAPLLSPALMAGWLFIFLIASRELSIAVLLSGPRSQVIAVAMLDLWQNGQAGELSALGLLWTVLMVVAASLFQFVERRSARKTFG
ncbi:MAG: iron ABC transporter permease [Mesorhizobium sp.]|nr:iron ABC transporter permease [Mesorhizobium sp.]MBN9241261.1 iron ABC transporter permease [Mesorhizobium sp.]